MVPVPLLPSIVAPKPPSVLTPSARSAGSATLAAAALTPVDHRLLARIARFLDGLRPPVSGLPLAAAGRNPSLRDPARERDATSFGIRSARMSASGAVVAGFGIGARAAQFIDLAKVARKVPVRFSPTMCQGGGGVSLKGTW